MKVGFVRDTYSEKRLIINKSPRSSYFDISGLDREQFPDFYNDNERYYSSQIDTNDVDVVHYFNQINYGKTFYVTTFESTLPRYWNKQPFAIGLNVIARDACRKIIAFSDFTSNLQRSKIEASDLSLKKKTKLLSKLTAIHPPQRKIDNDGRRFDIDTKFKCIFISNDFFRKGGLQLLRVLEKFKRRGFPVELTIIGRIGIGYNVTDASMSDLVSAIEFILKNKEWINWYQQLENSDVLRITASQHVGFLPTFSDTYGYSVLEMQAAGVPVVTTAVRALREINNNKCGWIVEHPEMDYFSTFSPAKKMDLMNIVEMNLEKVVNTILMNPCLVKEKSKISIDRIIRFHDPKAYGDQLQTLYESAL